LRGAGPTTGVTIISGEKCLAAWNGSDFVKVSSSVATALTGTLPVANGGTGATTLTANNVILGNGTSAVQFVAPGTTGNVLTSDGTTWGSSPGATGDVTLTGTQTLTNKTIAFADNTLTDVAGTTATQTLTNKTISGADNTLTVDGTVPVGFRTIPQNSQSGAYTLVLADSGKHIFHPVGDNNARTFTIPANSSVAYPIGTAITFINMAVADVTIAITTDTLTLSPAGTSGSRTLATNGSATCIKVTATEWLISGSGLT
jgi:hypothetical protein